MPVDIELADDIYREKVLRARGTPLEQKLLAGPELFDMACVWMTAGIRSQFPDADDRRVRQLLLERLELARRIDNKGALNDLD